MLVYFSLYKILLIGKKNFQIPENCKKHFKQILVQKDKKFGEDEIVKLPEK